MAEFFDSIQQAHRDFIDAQPMFFTATACDTGRINLSPKGMDCFRVLSPGLCGYGDLTGSGNETAAHIRRDGRLTFMFNSFSRNALILRLYGQGEVVEKATERFDEIAPHFDVSVPGFRQIILMHVQSVQTSCSYAVPQMTLEAERQTLVKFAENLGEEKLAEYRRTGNMQTIDGFDTGHVER